MSIKHAGECSESEPDMLFADKLIFIHPEDVLASIWPHAEVSVHWLITNWVLSSSLLAGHDENCITRFLIG